MSTTFQDLLKKAYVFASQRSWHTAFDAKKKKKEKKRLNSKPTPALFSLIAHIMLRSTHKENKLRQ